MRHKANRSGLKPRLFCLQKAEQAGFFNPACSLLMQFFLPDAHYCIKAARRIHRQAVGIADSAAGQRACFFQRLGLL